MNFIGGIMKNSKNGILLIFILIIIGLLIIFSDKAKEGAVYGIAIAEKIIIQSLLPLLILINFIYVSKISVIQFYNRIKHLSTDRKTACTDNRKSFQTA